jgi:Putative auto-transporter adhesin, head GIN domain
MTITETRPVSGFDRISLRGYGDIVLEQGETESLTVETTQEMLSRLKTEVNNGELVLGFKSWFDIWFGHDPIKYTITFKSLRDLGISGSGKVTAEHLHSDELKLRVSGSGDVDIADLEAEKLDVHTSGSAKWTLAGKVTRQEISISGSGRYDAWSLDSQEAAVHVSGSGHLALKVEKTLDISISGAGDVSYIGDPQVKQSVSGSGKVKKVTA